MKPHEYAPAPSAREQGHRLEALPRKEGRKTAAERGRRRPRSPSRAPEGQEDALTPCTALQGASGVEFGWHHAKQSLLASQSGQYRGTRAGLCLFFVFLGGLFPIPLPNCHSPVILSASPCHSVPFSTVILCLFPLSSCAFFHCHPAPLSPAS